jgi:two-component system, chemotaxis family, protein-glutamate methylesterase/glutaminase
MTRHDIFVVGASAGGVPALRALVGGFPPDLAASVFIVLHIGSDGHPSMLPKLLTAAGPLLATCASQREAIAYPHIYVAPPNYHLVVTAGYVSLSQGPKEKYYQPSIDLLLRSAPWPTARVWWEWS